MRRKETKMAIQPDINSPETVLRRIDVIVDELLALRASVRNLIDSRPTKAEATNDPESVLDIVRDAPGHQLFQSADDVKQYLRTERSAWDN
jgi:hypothetical protein